MAMRLDKYLAQAGIGTRSEVKKLIRQGRVFLDGVPAKRPEEKVNEDSEVQVDGAPVRLEKYEYFMLNKPAGVVTATRDREQKTVLDLLDCTHGTGIFPVGRLDKDTEGLLLLTNDGALAHELLSPKKHVEKTYFVRVKGLVTEEDIRLFAEGLDIGDEKLTKPAVLEVLCCSENQKRAQSEGQESIAEAFTELLITITEGRYHQIKRMFEKVGKPVMYLKRQSMGGLVLDEGLALGEYRRLTEEEIGGLRGRNGED